MNMKVKKPLESFKRYKLLIMKIHNMLVDDDSGRCVGRIASLINYWIGKRFVNK